MTWEHPQSQLQSRPPAKDLLLKAALVVAVVVVAAAWGTLKAQTTSSQIQDITGNYDFLKPYNTLAILQEDTMLKGYIDVYQGKSASSAILSYPITSGERKGNHVEFRTRTIHAMYYRFSGTVQRGKGKMKGEPDYLELVGELQTVETNSVTNKTKVIKRQVVFKSQGRVAREP